MIQPRRILLALAFFPVGIAVYELWELPGTAAAQGVGSGEMWFAVELGAAVATLVVLFSAFAATTLESQDRPLASVMPMLAALVTFGARMLATYGAPDQLYLTDDIRFWIATVVGAVVFGAVAAMAWPFGARPKTLA